MTGNWTQHRYPSLFESNGDRLVPTPAARGPWRSDSLHGGAVSALFANGVRPHGWVLARMTVDFIRRVPMSPLRLVAGGSSETRRARREILELWADDRLVAEARCLLLPERQIDAFPPQSARLVSAPHDLSAEELEQGQSAIAERIGYPSFVSHGIAVQRARIGTGESSSTVNWVKSLVPTIAGQPITAVERACAAADFANGGFSSLPFDKWTFVNLDLTVQLVRPPVDDWIAVANNSAAASTGVGLGGADLFDVGGRFGGSTATLLLERR
jgi:hypothetical protein